MPPELSRIRLRPARAGEGDRAFAFAVKQAALRCYVEPIWGWDESFQIEFHRRDWAVCRPAIIQLDDHDIGTIEVRRLDGAMHLGEFYLLPEWQRRGIGSHLLSGVIAEADAKRVPLRLEVLKNNPVRSLYARFGFVAHGETPTHHLMERPPGYG